MIVLEHVSKRFDGGGHAVEAVKDVSLHIEKGTIAGIIGFSGAGKSTLVRCINLLEAPTSGRVTVNGQELTGMDERALRRARKKIGMIFQSFNLMPSRTVFQNIAYPLHGSGLSREQIEEKVLSLLELVNMSEKRDAYPSQLSGGQKQRVAIARALASDPKVLLCDEATSALDPQTTRSILRLLHTLNERLGLTIVVITHEMAVIKEICGRVAVMENGAVVEQGEVFDIFSNPQQAITREFIHTTSNLSKIYDLIEEGSPVVELRPDELIVQLTYVEKNVSEALISSISRNFSIDVNIIFSSIEIIQNAPLGGLVAIMSGPRNHVEAAVRFLIEKNVQVEVIKDGRVASAVCS